MICRTKGKNSSFVHKEPKKEEKEQENISNNMVKTGINYCNCWKYMVKFPLLKQHSETTRKTDVKTGGTSNGNHEILDDRSGRGGHCRLRCCAGRPRYGGCCVPEGRYAGAGENAGIPASRSAAGGVHARAGRAGSKAALRGPGRQCCILCHRSLPERGGGTGTAGKRVCLLLCTPLRRADSGRPGDEGSGQGTGAPADRHRQ